MSEIKWLKLTCQCCGCKLLPKNDDMYVCEGCGKTYEKQIATDFSAQLNSALDEQKQEAVANLRQLLWKAIHGKVKDEKTGKIIITKEYERYISNKEVEKICDKILYYLPEDFYANFYKATCQKNKSALGSFLYGVDIDERYNDIPDMLNYMLAAEKAEWVMPVGDFIERAYKDNDLELYNEYRTKFEDINARIEDGIYEPALPRDVFVAYSSKDMQKVEDLVAVLEEAGFSCFVAARNLRHGSGSVENYENAIHTAIENCTSIVFVSSNNSRSFQCDAYKELTYIEKNCKNKPRVEYLIKNYADKPVETLAKRFFNNLEYCVSVDDVVERVGDIVTGGVTPPQAPVETPKTEGNFAKKIKRVRILMEAGEFEDAKERLEKLESAAEDSASDSELAEIYYYKMLFDYNVRSEDDLVSLLSQRGEEITRNKNYRLAKGYAEDNDGLLDKLLSLKNRISESIAKAKAEAAAKAEEEHRRKEEEEQRRLEEQRRKAEEEERRRKEEIQRKAKEEADRKAKEEAERKAEQERKTEAAKKAEAQRIADKKYKCSRCGGELSQQENDIYKCQSCGNDFIKSGEQFKELKCLRCGGRLILQKNNILKCNCGKTYTKSGIIAEIDYNTGLDYYNKKDYVNAVKWWSKAAEQGHSGAQSLVGYSYYNGQGVVRDYAEAVKWYRKAAEQGFSSAQNWLGYCYKKGQGVTKDYTEAVKWYRKAAEQGYANAQNNLGYCYEKGQGVVQNYAEAVKWYRKAAEQGQVDAQYNLGVCYKNGQGVTKDYAEAVKWYRKAAEQGYADAQNNLGVCYENGQGVDKNNAEAIKWYSKAAEQGNKAAQDNLKRLGETNSKKSEDATNKAEKKSNFFNEADYVVYSSSAFNTYTKVKQKQEDVSKAPVGNIDKDYLSIGDYKDIGGVYITFGTYPQSRKADNVSIGQLLDKERGYYLGSDNNLYAGYKNEYYKVEPIKWRVLQNRDAKFIVAVNIIDAQRFAISNNNYAESDIRKWLNGEFFDTAFNSIQKNMITSTTVDNSKLSIYRINKKYLCEDTVDKVFLLSRNEAEKYFQGNYGHIKGNYDRQLKPTEYAVKRGAFVYSDRKNISYNGYAGWWLRSPYGEAKYAQYVPVSGALDWGYTVFSIFGVVPAMKIKL